jgi:hypothetical protein
MKVISIYIYSHRLFNRAVIQEYFKLMMYMFNEELIFSVPQRISLTSQQLFVSHTIPNAEIPALVGSWVTNTLAVKILFAQK